MPCCHMQLVPSTWVPEQQNPILRVSYLHMGSNTACFRPPLSRLWCCGLLAPRRLSGRGARSKAFVAHSKATEVSIIREPDMDATTSTPPKRSYAVWIRERARIWAAQCGHPLCCCFGWLVIGPACCTTHLTVRPGDRPPAKQPSFTLFYPPCLPWWM